jgi:sec-independent protein translocase protein TatC
VARPRGLYDLLAQPMVAHLPEGTKLIATNVISPFLVPLKITLMAAFLVALPYVLYQVWAFVAPGLYSHEKKLVLPLVVSSTLLFFAAWRSATSSSSRRCRKFIQAFAPTAITAAPDIEQYFGFVLTLFMVSASPSRCRWRWWCWRAWASSPSSKLKEFRGYFIVGAFVIAAIITPPDVVSQLALAIPMCMLYELGIWRRRHLHQAHQGARGRGQRASRRAPDGAPLALLRGAGHRARAARRPRQRPAPSARAAPPPGAAARLQRGHRVSSCVTCGHRLGRPPHHHVAGRRPALAGRAVLQHAGDQHAA